MPAGQKKLFLVLALLLALQAFFNLGKYIHDMPDGGRFGGDFVVFWQAGKDAAAADVLALYANDKIDGSRIISREASVLAQQKTAAPFVYPPHLLLALWPLAYLEYHSAVIAWSVLSLALFYWFLFKAYGFTVHEPKLRLVLAAVMLPMLSANLFSGQMGTWVAILFLLIISYLDKRPVWAGMALGVLTVKPHLGILWPVALVVSGRWRVVMAATVTAVALVLAVTAWLGIGIWPEYARAAQFFSDYVLVATSWFAKLALAPFISLQAIGVPPVVAGVAQVAVAVGLVFVMVKLFRERDPARQDLRFGLLAVGALLAAPYALAYDSPLLAVALMPLIIRAWNKGWKDGFELMALLLVLVMPYAQGLFLPYHVPFGMLSLCTLFVVMWRRDSDKNGYDKISSS